MAFGSSTVTDFGAGVSDLFAAKGDELKAQGEEFERQNYLLASQFATENEEFTKQSTLIKTNQADRQLFSALGTEKANIAGAGLASSGSALDLLRESAQEGATTRAVLARQGLITEAGYAEQAQSYQNLASAAEVAEEADKEAAKGADISAGFKFAAGIASLFTGGVGGGGGGGGFTPSVPSDPNLPMAINQYAPPSPPPANPTGAIY